MEPHLIVLDLDGTLLTDEKQISDQTFQALQRARQEGHEVIIATGRPYRSSIEYYEALELHSPIVNFNGSLAHHPKDETWPHYHKTIERATVEEIITFSTPFQVQNVVAEVLDKVYLAEHDELLMPIFNYGESNIEYGDILSLLQTPTTSLLIQSTDEHFEAMRQSITSTYANVVDHYVWGAPYHMIELVPAGVTKATGVEHVAKQYGIPRERIIAFGDNANDVKMLQYAGTGVAMSNAIPEAQEAADLLTRSNNEDGIAHYLESHFNWS